jgi:hypothetical protein
MRFASAVVFLIACGSSAPRSAAPAPAPAPVAKPAPTLVPIPAGSCCCEFTYDVDDGHGGGSDYTHAAPMTLEGCKASAGTCLANDRCTTADPPPP